MYTVSLEGSFEIDPHDYIECKSVDEVESAIEDRLTSEVDLQYIDNWDVDDEFFDEWARLRKEELTSLQDEYDEFN